MSSFWEPMDDTEDPPAPPPPTAAQIAAARRRRSAIEDNPFPELVHSLSPRHFPEPFFRPRIRRWYASLSPRAKYWIEGDWLLTAGFLVFISVGWVVSLIMTCIGWTTWKSGDYIGFKDERVQVLGAGS